VAGVRGRHGVPGRRGLSVPARRPGEAAAHRATLTWLRSKREPSKGRRGGGCSRGPVFWNGPLRQVTPSRVSDVGALRICLHGERPCCGTRLIMGKRLRWAMPVVAGAMLLGPFAASGARLSGVRGALRLSHGCPGPVRPGPGHQCDFAGAEITIRVFRSSGSAVTAARTNSDGRFVIALRPGRYLLRAEVPNLPQAENQPVRLRIRSARWTAVTLRYLVPPYMV
jgi:hypothetical protein